jgi:peptidoglycan/xylan/chitin deacetylase (PgdA/CDA1 family)
VRSLQHALLLAAAVLVVAGWGAPRPPRLRLPHLRPPHAVDVPILMYHRIAVRAVGLPGLTVSPAAFAAEMRWLHRAGYHAITQRELYEALRFGLPLPARPVLITFDDGYRDVLWNAAPLLRRLRMPATEYVITARVGGGDPSFLSWPELRRLERLGFDIGSHTVDHRDLTLLSPARARAELVESRRALQRHLGASVRWLSYPLGRVDPQVVRLARRAGYLLAVTTEPGSVQPAREPLLLHRDEILPWTGVSGLHALVESGSR